MNIPCEHCRRDPEFHYLPGGETASFCLHRSLLEVHDGNGRTVTVPATEASFHEAVERALGKLREAAQCLLP